MSIGPGSTIGIIGGGQLGRMLAMAAAELGYKCHILDPGPNGPASQVSAHFTQASFDDLGALREFADGVDVATYEFENLPVAPLDVLGDKLRPSARSLAIAQDRAKEKAFIEALRRSGRAWREVSTSDEVAAAASQFGCPLVLKTRRWGYDGKGQAWVRSERETAQAWSAIGEEPAVAEAGIDFFAEFSVIVARWADGRCVHWDSAENQHGDGILRRSSVPCRETVAAQLGEAREAAIHIAEALDHVGVLTVEFFAATTGRWSTRSRRASTTAATGRSKARSPPSSSSTSARSATCHRVRPAWLAPAR